MVQSRSRAQLAPYPASCVRKSWQAPVLYDADALNALGGSLSLTLFGHFLPGSQKLSDAASDCQLDVSVRTMSVAPMQTANMREVHHNEPPSVSHINDIIVGGSTPTKAIALFARYSVIL
uniref:Uncharacterized protein n=1 Tax=Anopheles coluzzii TaxID=1518534 RepID=A0A8W7PL90_ANOCL